jgi:dihydroneopterin aldolase
MTETTDPQPVVVSFLPVRYDELHDSLVPPDIRDTPRYKKYMLSVKTGYFYEHFRLIEDVAS